MESTSCLCLAVFLVTTFTVLSTSSAAPAVNAKGKRSAVITDDQIVQLKQLLARLRAENEYHSQASVEKPSNKQHVKEGQQEEDQQSSAASTTHKPQFRAVSAEDMRDKDTDIVEQLRRLDKADTAEILERALSKVKQQSRDSGEDAESEEKKESGSNSAGDDMGTSNNGDEAQSTTENDHVDGPPLIEALIKQAQAQLDRESDPESRPLQLKRKIPVKEPLDQQIARYLDLLRTEGTDEENKKSTEEEKLREKDPESRPPQLKKKGPVKEPLNQQIARYLDHLRAEDRDEENEESIEEEQLREKRAEGGDEENEESTEEEQLREKAIQIVESRLMQDIHMANMLGVSVEDLIRDLEEKAYIQANAEKIGELLEMHEQGRDKK